MLKIINQEHYDKVVAEVKDKGLMTALQIQLDYLQSYGCAEDPEKCIVELGYDFAPLSFGIAFLFKQADGSYKFFMNGGLIFHECSQSWSVHT